MSKMNVIPDDRTTWRLNEADAPVLQSQHSNTTGAERDARAPAEARGAERVAVHHRDHRTPDAVPSLAGLRARARRARARRLDAARELARQLATQSRPR